MTDTKDDLNVGCLGTVVVFLIIGFIGFIVDSCQGPKNGPFETTYFNGNLKTKGNYKDDEYDGIFYKYHRNGYLEESSTYVDGIRQGDYKSFYDDGALRFEAKYKNDLIQGLTYLYYKNSSLWEKAYYVNGVMVTFVRYYENGADVKEYLNVIEDPDSELSITIEEFDESKLIEFDGELTYGKYNKNGRLEEFILFINKSLNHINLQVLYYESGQTYFEAEMLDKQEKIYTGEYFYIDGALKSEGKLSLKGAGVDPEWIENGLWNYYFSDGSINKIISYKDGVEDGPYEIYDKNGKLISKGIFVEGTQTISNEDVNTSMIQ